MDLARHIRPIPDFPKPGILFRDITPLLADAGAFAAAIQALAEPWRAAGVMAIAAGRLGLDPAELARRNLVPADGMPYP
jgi:adenine/guanine phosphoribosyltransferase-like PRPP-binding protein